MFPAAVIEIGLSVGVDESVGVDGLGTVYVLIDEGFSESVLEGASGGFAGGDTDSGSVAGGEVHEVGAIAFDYGGGPGSAVGGPRDLGEIEDAGVLFPVREIGRGEAVEECLLFVGGGKGWVDDVLVLEEVDFGVGVVVGEDGVSGGGGGHEGEEGWDHCFFGERPQTVDGLISR